MLWWMLTTAFPVLFPCGKHENDFAAFCLEPLGRRAQELHLCMLARQPDEAGRHRRSVPERLGPYLYYTRRDEGKAFPVYVRRPVEGGLCDEHVVSRGESLHISSDFPLDG